MDDICETITNNRGRFRLVIYEGKYMQPGYVKWVVEVFLPELDSWWKLCGSGGGVLLDVAYENGRAFLKQWSEIYEGVFADGEIAMIDTSPTPVASKIRAEYDEFQRRASEDSYAQMDYVTFLETRIAEIQKIADDAMDEKDARIRELEAALVPFAGAADDFDVTDAEAYAELGLAQDEFTPITAFRPAMRAADWLSVAHLRIAAEALKAKQP